MNIKFKVKEDVSKYLTTLTERVDDGKKEHLHDMAELMTHKFIEPKAPMDYNPYLYKSGEQERRWVYDIDEGKSSVTVTYSGSTYKEDGIDDEDFMVWLEFSKEYHKASESNWYYWAYVVDAYERHLEREYAYYQETGIDSIASPEGAKHQGFIKTGVKESEKTIQNKTAGYLKQIFKSM